VGGKVKTGGRVWVLGVGTKRFVSRARGGINPGAPPNGRSRGTPLHNSFAVFYALRAAVRARVEIEIVGAVTIPRRMRTDNANMYAIRP